MQLLLSCEHGGNQVPTRWSSLFATSSKLLQSHRGYDPGALDIAQELALKLKAPLHYSEVTRLLVDLNRTETHADVFSRYTEVLPPEERELILKRHYYPYRQEVEKQLRLLIGRSKGVVHLSIHSFTPKRNGVIRELEIGILYDPAREGEPFFARQWKKELQKLLPEYRIQFNVPYRGSADGLTTALREHWEASQYLGIELEVNQKIWRGSRTRWQALKEALASSLATILGIKCE